jgi:hypothetical protein
VLFRVDQEADDVVELFLGSADPEARPARVRAPTAARAIVR